MRIQMTIEQVQMTIEQALKVQAEQFDWYSRNLRPEQVASLQRYMELETKAFMLEPGKLYDVVEINRYIPRGAWFETALGLPDMGGE